MKNPSKFIFFFFLILGTMISISSNSWLGVWMGLEINLLSFIPLMIEINNMISTETTLKYFLTQIFASLTLLFSMIFFILFNNLNFQLNIISFISFMIFISLLIKCGIAPFHFWFPNVMEGMTWMTNLLLMTWQKIAPLLLISYFIIFNFFYIFIIISAIISAIKGLNQISLKKILAFSSINHMSWMMTAMMMNEYMWMMYFFFYFIISISLIYLLNYFKIFTMNQMFSSFFNFNLLKVSLLMSLLSLGGLPPFLGFLPKWLIIQSMIMMKHYFLMMVLIMMSLITIFFYLRISYSSFMLNFSELIWFNKMQNSKLKMLLILQNLSINSFFIFLILTYILL